MPTPRLLRSRVNGLARLANGDLAALWKHLERAVDAEEALRDILPALITTYGSAASLVASEWYDEIRAKAEASKRFAAIPAAAGDDGAQALVGWALATSTDAAAFKTLIEGGIQRRIANHARNTVTFSSVKDPSARGWMRVGDGSSCDFCSMLLGRGAVYTEASADFQAHDHCGCQAAPRF